MENQSLPPIEREEWKQILDGSIDHKFMNLAFQLSVHTLRVQTKGKMISAEEGAMKLYKVSEKYYKLAIADLTTIFKAW